MKMKCFIVLLVCLMASGTFAATLNIIGSGNWTDPAIWSPSMPTAAGADEVKETVDNITVVVNTNVGTYTNLKIDIARGNTLSIQANAYMGNNKEIRPGDAGMSGSGTDVGYIVQTGGTLNIGNPGKLMIGYKAGGDGTYTISGGSLTGSGVGGGRMYVGCSSADGSTGKFKVVGDDALISLGGELYIANDSSTASGNTGNGTIEFNVVDGSVSKIQALKTIIDSQNEEAAIATLLVNSTGDAPIDDILLIENTGTSSVLGVFDGAAEGAIFNVSGVNMTLTYLYVAGTDLVANDIALLIPEPATLALLSLGLLAIRRNKK